MNDPSRKPVLVVGANPAWQKTVVCPRFEPGEVVRVKLEASGAAGKGFNTARAIRSFGIPVVLVSAAGPDATDWENACRDEGLVVRVFPIAGPIRTATTVKDLAAKQVTEIVEEGPEACADASEIVRSHLALELPNAALVVVAGTFPPGFAPQRAIEALVDATVPVILDSVPAIRALREMDSAPSELVLKLNESEWKAVFGAADLDGALKQARRLWPKAWFLATRGDKGALLVDRDDRRQVLTSEPIDPEVELNPIGAGDAFTGGLVVALHRGEAMPRAVVHGMAVGRASCSNPLPARFSMEDVVVSLGLVRSGYAQ